MSQYLLHWFCQVIFKINTLIRQLYNILEKPHLAKHGYLVQKLILLNTLINITSFALPYFFHVHEQIAQLLSFVNTATVMLFIFELAARYVAIGIDSRYRGVIGRIKYTFTPFILIDIIAIVPFFLMSYGLAPLRVIRLMRFFRLLKFIRMKRLEKKLVSINTFASSSLPIQILVLIIASAGAITFFTFAYSFSQSAMVFLDPPQIAELHTDFQVAVGVVELMVGLFIGGALISIMTSSLEQILKSINSGYFTYKESDHIVIINKNLKLDFLFEEINKYYIGEQEEKNIVILLSPKKIETFKKNLKEYSNLEITAIAGDPLNWNSYERVNINKASKVVLLLSRDKIKNENKKIAKFITNNTKFANEELSFVIETEHLAYSNEIYDFIFSEVSNHYTLVNNCDLIAKILNRSVVNYDYFKIYSELLSFDGNEFYILKYTEIFSEEITFKEASLQLSDAVLTGIVRENKILLNPPQDTELTSNDILILIMENRYTYSLDTTKTQNEMIMQSLPKPKVKEDRNIVIVGNHTDINTTNITQFLSSTSINKLKYIIKDDKEYMDKNLWKELRQSDVNVIILNLEDEYEFNLSLYLQGLYKNDDEFISKIVHILHNPTIAMLLSDNKHTNSMILSQKLIGEFISQSLFNRYTYDIFDEITQSRGNELYILQKDKYSSLYELEYRDLKSTLLENGMIYIGAFIEDKFIFSAKDIDKAEKIVVFVEGDIGL